MKALLSGLFAGFAFVAGFGVGYESQPAVELHKECFAMELVDDGYHGEGVDCTTGEVLSGEGMFIDHATLTLYDVGNLAGKRVAFYWTAQQAAQEEWGGVTKIEIEEDAE